MEQLPFILMTALAALGYYFVVCLERQLNEERSNHRVIRERESIASHMLFAVCRKLLLEKSSYINKDEVESQLIAVLNVQGYDAPRVEPPNEAEAESSNS